MTDEDDKKPKDPGIYRESPPDAPPPAPVQPTEYEKQLQAEAEARAFQQRLRSPASPGFGKKAGVVAIGGMGCLGIVLWLFAAAGVVVLVLIGLVIFSCSR
jgi:hypothetical protein